MQGVLYNLLLQLYVFFVQTSCPVAFRDQLKIMNVCVYVHLCVVGRGRGGMFAFMLKCVFVLCACLHQACLYLYNVTSYVPSD